MKYEPLNNIGVMIHAVDLDITKFVNDKLKAIQLTNEQNLLMALLWEREGISQNEMAAKLNKDKAGIARMISTLEKKGYIRRKSCPNDKRSVEVYLTEEGRKLGDDVIPINKNIIQALNNGMTEEEIGELRRLLMKIRGNVNIL
ncbi:MarR family transcriptional regulator [Bacillus sp. S3]|uniref:MarR family winged helix-turn-helix transcriptional regulator n=1 Tax=Bacillus sp. S3 TaxID=486398 RepID=UPI001189D700|nr:MarR family transcriptional regulator [Bacillus sp. S3]QCJ44265.1 MarR family transcriptional regulator [Bacillus sp. S3]